jgi:hypothetical protein
MYENTQQQMSAVLGITVLTRRRSYSLGIRRSVICATGGKREGSAGCASRVSIVLAWGEPAWRHKSQAQVQFS